MIYLDVVRHELMNKWIDISFKNMIKAGCTATDIMVPKSLVGSYYNIKNYIAHITEICKDAIENGIVFKITVYY